MECLIGLREPDGGTIEICGPSLATRAGEVKQRIDVALRATVSQERTTPPEALNLIGVFHPQRPG